MSTKNFNDLFQNISHKVLCYLLEYIYTGEVIVPCEYLESFGDAAKSLHIRGLENIVSSVFSLGK